MMEPKSCNIGVCANLLVFNFNHVQFMIQCLYYGLLWLTLLELFWSSLYEECFFFENASASWDLVWNFLFLGEFGDFDNAIYQIEDVKDYVFYPEQVRLSEIPSALSTMSILFCYYLNEHYSHNKAYCQRHYNQ